MEKPDLCLSAAGDGDGKVDDPSVAEIQVIPLSAEDRRLIAAAILDPPSPNGALLRAAAAYRRLSS